MLSWLMSILSGWRQYIKLPGTIIYLDGKQRARYQKNIDRIPSAAYRGASQQRAAKMNKRLVRSKERNINFFDCQWVKAADHINNRVWFPTNIIKSCLVQHEGIFDVWMIGTEKPESIILASPEVRSSNFTFIRPWFIKHFLELEIGSSLHTDKRHSSL